MFCFSQQNLPKKIFGKIPDSNSTKLYQIQVGAFKIFKNAEEYSVILSRGGLTPVYEKYLDYTRVMITGIPAYQVTCYLVKIKQLGFDEVIIRVDPERTIEEVIVEPEPEPEEVVIIKPEVIVETVEAEPTPEMPEFDIFCKTWSIVNSDKTDYIKYFMTFSNDGTFLITNTRGETSVAKWRWYDKYKAFEYSHDNWQNYGRATIHQLNQNSLIFNDPGYNILSNEGYSTIGKDAKYELVPIEN